MRVTDGLVAGVLALGAVGAVRRRQEMRRVRHGSAARVTALTKALPASTSVLEPLAHWWPAPPQTPTGRAAAAAWAAPLTVIGALLVAAGRSRAVWDDELGAYVATDVGGLSALLLRAVGVDANAIGQVIVCVGARPSRGLLLHESVHVRQCERLGPGIVVAYLWGSARHGYRDNPLERAARAWARAAMSSGRDG